MRGIPDFLKEEAELPEDGPSEEFGFFISNGYGFHSIFYFYDWESWRHEEMFKTMLVEDSASFRRLVKDNLQDQFPSMDIIEAADGIEAFQKIDSHPPNLIFMDIGLPGENGLELTRKIKADYPDVIIIILTNHDSPEYRKAANQYKADYFFSKDAIVNDGIFTLVKSILLGKGFGADGSERR